MDTTKFDQVTKELVSLQINSAIDMYAQKLCDA